jgi:hypothetical protein
LTKNTIYANIVMNMETREQTTTPARGAAEIDSNLASGSMIKDLYEAPVYANQFTDQALLDRAAIYSAVPAASALDAPMPAAEQPHVSAPLQESVPTTVESVPEQQKGRIARALGRIATGFKKVDEKYFAGFATVAGVLPGLKKEKILAAENRHREKYARKDSDSFLLRSYKAFRRNQYRALAWTPAIALGGLAVDLAVVAGHSLPHTVPTESIAANTNPLELAAPAAIDSHINPAPAPAPVPAGAESPNQWHWSPEAEAASAVATQQEVASGHTHSSNGAETPTHHGEGAPKQRIFESKIHDGNKVPDAKTPSGKRIVVLTGGATDPDGLFIRDQLIANGTIDPAKDEIILNHYPAEMAPFVGTHTTQESTAIGAQGLRDIIAQNPDRPITSYEFSEGNFPADTVAAELARAGNHNVNFVGYGSGNSASGLLNNPLAETFRPIVDGLGITRTPPAPGSTMILDGRDIYASNAGKLDIDMEAHRIVGPNEPRVLTFDVNGVHYEVVGTTIPLPPGAILTSGVPAPGFGGLPQALIPGVNTPPDPNLPQAPDFVPDMNQLPPAPQDIVPPAHLDAPAQFGDAPCVAPNGDQYFTGVGQPC